MEGGKIAGNTRKELEDKLGKSIVTGDNFLRLEKKKVKKLLDANP